MRTYNNGLKKIIKRLPNDGCRSGWTQRVQEIIKAKKLPPVSNSLLYSLVNDHTGLTPNNIYLAEIIMIAVDELSSEFEKIMNLIEESV